MRVKKVKVPNFGLKFPCLATFHFPLSISEPMPISVFSPQRVLPAFILAFLLAGPVTAQRTKEVTSVVKDVTVFLQHAQVFSSASTNVAAGETEIALINVPANLNESSIQVEARGNAMLLGIRYEQNYLQANQKPKEVLQVEDSLQSYQNRIRMLTDQNDVYRKEEALMQANQSIGGANKGVEPDDLEDIADLFRSRLFSIRKNILTNEIKIKLLNAGFEKNRNQLSQLNNRRAMPTGRILVTVSAENPTPLKLEVNYVVYNAGWQPVYDLRATNTKSPMKLFYKANVFQNTGVNWSNVNLTLATSNPGIGAIKPELQPWYLQLYDPRPPRQVKTKLAGRARNEVRVQAAPAEDSWGDASGLSEEEKQMGFAETVSDYTAVTETSLAVNFKIGVPYSVPSDGKKQLVDIQQFEVPATYKYAAVPKLTSEAFLIARLTGWDEYNILPGEANIFFEGTFTGKTELNPQATGDSLVVSLGRDKRVVVARENVKDYKSKSLLGNSRKETRGYLISVRNTKNEAIEIMLEDQIPVSNNKEIEVDLEDAGGGNLDKTTGKVTWNLKLNPNETKKLPLKFSVKYPKNQQVPGL